MAYLGVEEDEVELDEGEGELDDGLHGAQHVAATRRRQLRLEQLPEAQPLVDQRADPETCGRTSFIVQLVN